MHSLDACDCCSFMYLLWTWGICLLDIGASSRQVHCFCRHLPAAFLYPYFSFHSFYFSLLPFLSFSRTLSLLLHSAVFLIQCSLILSSSFSSSLPNFYLCVSYPSFPSSIKLFCPTPSSSRVRLCFCVQISTDWVHTQCLQQRWFLYTDAGNYRTDHRHLAFAGNNKLPSAPRAKECNEYNYVSPEWFQCLLKTI